MTDGFTLKLSVQYSSIYNEEPKDLKTYLTGIKRSDLLKATAFFLSFSNRNSKFDDYKEFLSMFFCEENNKLANEIYYKLDKLRSKHKSELIIINPLTGLQLFEFCFNNLTDHESQSKGEAERNIFKAILFQNEENTNAQNLAFETTKELDSEIRLPALSLSQTFAYSDLVNYDISEVLVGQIIKSIYLFEFLETNTNTKYLLESFLDYFNCNNWKEYLKRVFPLVSPVIKGDQEAQININIEKGDDFKKSCDFIEKLTILDNEFIDDYDFIKIRSKPIYNLQEGDYRIIYGLFVIELLHKGLFFKLSEINKKLIKKEKVKGDFRGFYCDEFSEKFLLYKILNSIYQNRYIEYSGAEIKAKNIEAEPDYYIRKGNSIFLFESKDILINAKIKHTYDFKQYTQAFQKKLYYDENEGKIENKAVLQLTKNVERLLKKQFSIDTNYKPTSIKIYPIIVLHDQQFNIAGLNVLINYWFKIEIEKLKENGINVDKVKPITIINIDSLIFHQDLFRQRTIKLEKILDNYHKFVTFDRKKKYQNEDHKNQFVKRTLIPFSIFLSNYLLDQKIVKIPTMINEKGFSLFN